MDKKRILAAVDHTLLNVDATWEQVKTLCDEAVRYQVATVCLPPAYAAEAVDYLEGKLPVCVVVGFPNGYSTRAAKVFEAREAIDNGAAEIDMVINVGFLKSGRYDAVLREIRAVKDLCNEHILKVIVECCLLTEQEKIKMCELVTESGADYIKTSTGFSKGGATRDDVALLARHVGAGVKIKAAGGIRTLQDACEYLKLGASRLGASSLVELVKKEEAASS
ncbi:MAG: deoxyribose-phosphate aldolase [Dethiobacteria bacterium]|jgi:deoxyribose-phosphate aldolase